jgi:protease IV
LRLAARDDSIHGVLLAIDSPGGGVTDSDEIYQMLERFRKEHPQKRVLALFGDIAASGGYYIAAAAERIMARRTTITGSIGVIMEAWNFAEAAKKLGVDEIAIKSAHTPFKDIMSPTRPMTEAEHALLTGIVEELYQQFVTVVDDGRPNLDRAQVQALASGAIYSAKQALENGLIDQIGGELDAIGWFESALGAKVELLDYRKLPSLRDLLFGAKAPAPPSLEQAAAQLFTQTTGPRCLYFWQGGR